MAPSDGGGGGGSGGASSGCGSLRSGGRGIHTIQHAFFPGRAQLAHSTLTLC